MSKCTFNKFIVIKKSFSSQKSHYWHWPKGISHSAWQKVLQKRSQVAKQKSKDRWQALKAYRNKYKKGTWKRQHLSLQQSLDPSPGETRQLRTMLNRSTEALLENNNSLKLATEKPEEKIELITMLKQFLERKHVSEHIEKTIPDRRNQELITYKKQSLMMSGLSIFLLRMGSCNKYSCRSRDNDEKYTRANVAKFINAPENRVPAIKTIENFLKNLSEASINNLMILFFQDLLRSKFFKHHPEVMVGDFFLLAADCVHTHTYEHPHHVNKNGDNDCSCCLKRVYNKGTDKEKTKWLHSTLVFAFVFFGGLKIPIYRHPIHSKQLSPLIEVASDENHKQECELVALKMALPAIRHAFPRMKLVLNLDGLYANRPIIRLLNTLNCGHIIVRKEKSFPSLKAKCDEFANLDNYKKNCMKTWTENEGEIEIKRTYQWFNQVDIGEGAENNLKTNVLRFSETKIEKGKIKLTKKGEPDIYQCEWLFSWPLSAKTCQLAAAQARLRWEEEDLFNALKNRGFNLGHDYSRNPRSFFNWQGLSLFAFGIFELFRFSEAVKQKCNLPQSGLADKLKGQLLHRPTEELFSESSLATRIQFRYNFVIKVNPCNGFGLKKCKTKIKKETLTKTTDRRCALEPNEGIQNRPPGQLKTG